MGIEIIYPIAWLISACALILLIWRSRDPDSRPYTLPTLILSVAIALVLAWSDHADAVYRKPHLAPPYWQYFFVWFAPPALVLGLHAHLIRWLVRKHKASAP